MGLGPGLGFWAAEHLSPPCASKPLLAHGGGGGGGRDILKNVLGFLYILINNYSTPTQIFTFNYYLISNVSPHWLHQE